MRRPFIVLVVAALVAAGCGAKSKTRERTAARTTDTTTAPLPTTTASSSTDCNALGINPTGMREGTCTHAGVTWVIVDENHTLRLKTLWATLAGVRTATTLTSATARTSANGRFVIATVTITNQLPSPQSFDQAGTQQAGLILAGAVFKEAVSAESAADADSCLKLHDTPIQPRSSETCDVIFDVPTSAAADLGKHGSGDLYLVDFGSDLAGSAFPQMIGQIRLYH